MSVSESAATGWRAWAATDRGLVRSENQDAWAVLWDQESDGGRCHVFAVFDGVGGLPAGAEAARAAADALVGHLDGGPVDALLARMNEPVRSTGGGTTAVVAVARLEAPGTVDLLSVGDSSAYVLAGGGELSSVAPRDAGRGHEIRDFLGNPGLRGHVVRAEVATGQALLLCTDGVDKVAEPEVLRAVLEAPTDSVGGRVEALLQRVRERGAPDNATVVVARHLG